MNITHGASKRDKRLYGLWNSMLHRCENPKREKFKIYGARGISVCEEYVNTPVLIHAGKNVDKDAVDFLACIGLMMFEQPMPDTYQTGGIVGALIFQGEGTNRFSSWREEGLNHWAIERAWPVPFHPCKGQLGFFRVDYPHDIKALA